MSRLTLPTDYTRIRVVRSFDELVSTPIPGWREYPCWERPPCGGFYEILARLPAAAVDDGIVILDASWLDSLPVSSVGRKAIDLAVADLRSLRELGLEPSLDCIFRHTPSNPGQSGKGAPGGKKSKRGD